MSFIRLTEEQINAWNLPTRPTKTTDTRAKNFGDMSVELDAIQPELLRGLVRYHINQHLPKHQLEVLKVAERSERDLLSLLARKISQPAD